MSDIRILIKDVDEWVSTGLSNLLNKQDGISSDKVLNYKDGILKYNMNKYDFVIIDFSSSDGNKLQNEIFMKNKEQKIITLSEDTNCSTEISCDFCIEHYNKKRLLKPYKFYEILNTIKNFDKEQCRNYNKLEKLN